MYRIFKEQKLEKHFGFLRVICLENEHPWWNMILWTTSLPSTWPKVYSTISLHKVTMTFSQEFIWRGETCYTNIVVSGLGLTAEYTEKWRPRDSWAFRLSSRTIEERFRKVVIFVCWLTANYTLLLLTHFRKTKYSDWLRSIFYFYLLTFGKPARWQ